MEKRPNNLNQVILEIFNGSSCINVGGHLCYIRHPNFIQEQEIDAHYNFWFEKAQSKKLFTNEQLIAKSIANKTWSEENETKIKNLQFEIDSLNKLKLKSARAISMGDIDASLSEKTQEISKLYNLKDSLLKNSAENFALNKAFNYKIFVYFYKDKECKEKLFSKEDYDELEENDIFNHYLKYIDSIKKFNENSLKWAAFSNDFLTIYSIYQNSQEKIFNCAPLDLSFYQRELIILGRRLYGMINNGNFNIPEKCFAHPDLILNYNPNDKNNSVETQDRTAQLIGKAKKHGEFSAKDLDKDK